MLIHEIIEELESTKSRLKKEAILQEHKDNLLLQKVFRFALDPTINYHVKMIPETVEPTGNFVDNLMEAVDKQLFPLINREKTGNEAIAHLQDLISSHGEEDQEILRRIVRRNMRCGVSATTVNKVWPKLIYVHPYMGGVSYKKDLVDKMPMPAIIQTKEDGMFVDIIVDKVVDYRSRNGKKLYVNNPTLDKLLLEYADGYVLKGEILVTHPDGSEMLREEGNGLINSDDVEKVAQDGRIKFKLWDAIPTFVQNGDKPCLLPYSKRISILSKIINDVDSDLLVMVDTETVNTKKEAYEFFKEKVSHGFEGAMLKSNANLWSDGKPNSIVKMKIPFECELKIIGFKQGKVATQHENTLGSILCASPCGLLETSVGSLKKAFRDEVWNNKDGFLGKIITVKSNGITKPNPDGVLSLLFARLVEVREDKIQADDLPSIHAAWSAAIDLAAA